MRMLTVLFLLLLISPAYGQLTKEDLRTIIKEEVRPIIKEEIAASEKRTREYIDLKVETINAKIDGTNARIDALNQRVDDVENNLNTRIDDVENNLSDKIGALDNSLNARIDDIRIMMIALIGLIAAAIALPQIIIAYKDRGRKEMQTQQQEMQAQIDELRKELSVGPSPHHPDKI